MSFLKSIGGALQKVGGAVAAVPGLNLIGGAASIGGSLLQGRAPSVGQIGGLIPGVGTVTGIAGGLAGLTGGSSTGRQPLVTVQSPPTAMFTAPPASAFTAPPAMGGSGGMGNVPAPIVQPTIQALRTFLDWAARVGLATFAAEQVSSYIQRGVDWFQWTPTVRDIWNRFGQDNGRSSVGMMSIGGKGCETQVCVEPVYEARATAPKGYVIVTLDDGQKVAMLREIARKHGYWKPARKPPITASEYRQLQTAGRVENKIKRLAQRAGQVCRPRKTR
jgi:hypothetical protein